MSTFTDGAPPSVAPEPQDGPGPEAHAADQPVRPARPDRPADDERDDAAGSGSMWLQGEIARRVAANGNVGGSSTARHARRDRNTRDAGTRPGPVPADPAYVPRHSVATPGPATAAPAPVGGPVAPAPRPRRKRTRPGAVDPATGDPWTGPLPTTRPDAPGALGGPGVPSRPVAGEQDPPPRPRPYPSPSRPVPHRDGAGALGGPGVPSRPVAGEQDPPPRPRPYPSPSRPAPRLDGGPAQPPRPSGPAAARLLSEPSPPPSRTRFPTSFPLLRARVEQPSNQATTPVPVRAVPARPPADVEPGSGPESEPHDEIIWSAASLPPTLASAPTAAPPPTPPTPVQPLGTPTAAQPPAAQPPAAQPPAAQPPAAQPPAAPTSPVQPSPVPRSPSPSPASPSPALPSPAPSFPAPSFPAPSSAAPSSPAPSSPVAVPAAPVAADASPGAVPWQRAAEPDAPPRGARFPRSDEPVPDAPAKRVRVVLAERKGVARPVRTVVDIEEGTGVGELLRSNLIGSQLSAALRFAAVAGITLGVLPALFALFPVLGRIDVLGIRLPWLLLGLLVYPFLWGLGWWHTRAAERVEQNFADHVQE